ncbi:hypothetical protein QA612_17835 [Evansella sp. AB-P1]|uniref:hypothetical protein n=1 Tax=Evansella sp. AB-P1 TaxID=3037653 RepID=UPI00241E2E53|nr:hypothetical protein [Evansella sp. AB-P1]MDG5789325.1 hypothetical protein [Evansella sp. AB-P1]
MEPFLPTTTIILSDNINSIRSYATIGIVLNLNEKGLQPMLRKLPLAAMFLASVFLFLGCNDDENNNHSVAVETNNGDSSNTVSSSTNNIDGHDSNEASEKDENEESTATIGFETNVNNSEEREEVEELIEAIIELDGTDLPNDFLTFVPFPTDYEIQAIKYVSNNEYISEGYLVVFSTGKQLHEIMTFYEDFRNGYNFFSSGYVQYGTTFQSDGKNNEEAYQLDANADENNNVLVELMVGRPAE